jgi:hypothetical protein
MLNDKQSKIINTLRVLSDALPEFISELEDEFVEQNSHIAHLESETGHIKDTLRHLGKELMNL